MPWQARAADVGPRASGDGGARTCTSRQTRLARLRWFLTAALLALATAVASSAPAAAAALDPVGDLGDPLRSRQWALDLLGAEQVWERQTADGVVVAVLDTGVDASHPDLQGVVLPGHDVLGGSADGRVDPAGHGTGVASVIAARVGNGVGGAGLAPGVEILPVRVLDENRSGLPSQIAEGVDWAVDAGADVLNLSLGSTVSSSRLDQAIERARRSGVVVVASAGNTGEGGAPTFPAAGDLPVSVGAVDRRLAVATFSTSGPTVDLAAPGVDLLVAAPGASWVYDDGTSYAAPHVSAAAALLVARHPRATPPQTVRRLAESALDLGSDGVDESTGWGLVRPLEALDASPGAGCLDLVPGSDGGVPDLSSADGAPLLRVQGEDRVATAAAVACTFWPDARRSAAVTSTVVLARADAFPDALAGAPLAARLGAPLLLTGSASVHEQVWPVLTQLGVREVVLLGGDAALLPSVEDDLRDFGFAVPRLEGRDRFATAASVAELALAGQPDSRVVVVNGWSFPDAVAAGAYLSGGPPTAVLLTGRDAVPPATLAALAAVDPAEVVVVGGDAVVEPSAIRDLDAATSARVRRVAGPDRYATSAAVLADSAVDPRAAVVLATGAQFPDALAAGPLAARTGGGLLLVPPTDVPRVAGVVQRGPWAEGVLVGGPAAVGTQAGAVLRAALDGS